jgi:hypothetical protein
VSSSRLFEPFDIARWERASVEQLKEEIEHDAARVEQLSSGSADAESGLLNEFDDGPPTRNTTRSTVESQVSDLTPHSSSKTPVEQSSTVPVPAASPLPNGPPVESSVGLPLLRQKYDLRPYGFSIILDFGWSREK